MNVFLKIVLIAAFFLFPAHSWAGPSHNVKGFAWSSNIGWISFNSTNDHDPATAGIQPSTHDYGVHKNTDGTLVGYAWSSNIGWIRFGGLSGFPVEAGTVAQNAQITGSSLVGWARACGGTLSAPNDCSVMTPRADGWDGWISLQKTTAPAYGVTYSGTSFTGYAWGSDVVGWILFDPQSVLPPAQCSSCGVSTGGDVTFDVKVGGASINGNTSVVYGSAPTYEWTITDLPSVSCDIEKVSGSTPFTNIIGRTTSGSYASPPASTLTDGAHVFQIDCINPTITKQVTFTVAPQPAGFSLGGTETARIQFLSSGSADSEIENIFVYSTGSFTSPVTVSISTYPTPPAGVTFLYSLGGGAFVANPAPVTISHPYAAGTTFQVRVSDQITTPYTVTLTGVGGTAPNATKNIIIDPTSFDPKFEEI